MTELTVSNRLGSDVEGREVVEAGVRDALESRPGGPWNVTITHSAGAGRIAIDILVGGGTILCMSVARTDTREQIAARVLQFVAW